MSHSLVPHGSGCARRLRRRICLAALAVGTVSPSAAAEPFDLSESIVPRHEFRRVVARDRIPALTNDELQGYVDKLIAVESARGAWRPHVVLLADNPDGAGHFPWYSDAVATMLPSTFSRQKIYLSGTATGTAEAREALGLAWSNGIEWVNYVGHGGLDRLAEEALLAKSDVPRLVNNERSPILTAWTCAISRFELPAYRSLGEELVMSADGGALVVVAPTGLSAATEAARMNELFYGFALRPDMYSGLASGRSSRAERRRRPTSTVGEALLRTFESSTAGGGTIYMRQIYTVLGDPAVATR